MGQSASENELSLQQTAGSIDVSGSENPTAFVSATGDITIDQSRRVITNNYYYQVEPGAIQAGAALSASDHDLEFSSLPDNSKLVPPTPKTPALAFSSPGNLLDQIAELLETLDALTISDNLHLVVKRMPPAIRGRIKQNAEPKQVANVFANLFEQYDQYRQDLLDAINFIEANGKSYRNLKTLVEMLD